MPFIFAENLHTMAIKVTVGEPKTEGKTFPKYMIYQEGKEYIIILATGENEDVIQGTCIESNCKQVGYFSKGWIRTVFKDLKGTLLPQSVQQTEPKPYPKLMKGDKGSIVEVLEVPEYGFAPVVVRKSEVLAIGYDRSFCLMRPDVVEKFTDFNGTITLENA